MSMSELAYIESAAQLKTLFKIDEISDVYKDYQPYSDRKAGFSVKRDYPTDFRYKPPTTINGTAVTFALIGIVYHHPDDTGEQIIGTKVPIHISIDLYNNYLSTHREYDFEDPNCPTEESVRKSNLTPKPASCLVCTDFAYDHRTGTLINKRGKIVSGKQVLDEAFFMHCNTIHRIKGLGYRWRKRSRRFNIGLFERFEKTFTSLLKLLGYTLQPKIGFSLMEPYKKENLKESKKRDFPLFGYKTSKNVVIIFSFLIVLAFLTILILLPDKQRLLDKWLSNALLVACFAIIILWILDYLIPRILFALLNIVFCKKMKLMQKAIKV